MAQARLKTLAYTSPLEALGEKFHTSPALLRKLNPAASFKVEDRIRVPNVLNARGGGAGKGESVTITVSQKTSALTIQTVDGTILFHAPVTTGSRHDPLPVGRWKVTGIRKNPNFFYNPDLFWDAEPAQSKAKIAPGPNNPVGLVWIDINKEHYGLHGTSEPSRVGQTESHGCVRLTNWDALKVATLVRPGTLIIFE